MSETPNQGSSAGSVLASRSGEPEITPVLVAEHGLSPDEYERILGILGR